MRALARAVSQGRLLVTQIAWQNLPMAKRQVQVRELSYGVYDAFDGKNVPRIQQFGDRIPAQVGVEFGMVLQVNGTRGDRLAYRIDHPRIRDDNGKDMPAFTGEWILVGPQQIFLG